MLKVSDLLYLLDLVKTKGLDLSYYKAKLSTSPFLPDIILAIIQTWLRNKQIVVTVYPWKKYGYNEDEYDDISDESESTLWTYIVHQNRKKVEGMSNLPSYENALAQALIKALNLL